jgi:hypothetical protein
MITKLSKQNNNFNYILTAINCFSKYAFAVHLKNKMGSELVVKNIFKNV